MRQIALEEDSLCKAGDNLIVDFDLSEENLPAGSRLAIGNNVVAVRGRNATLASLIEISYPVFVALFAWLLFREIHVNASVVVGGLLVFAGVCLIVWNNP